MESTISGPILALAIRGTFARSLWIEAVGPSDPVLARRTDPGSLIAQFGGESRLVEVKHRKFFGKIKVSNFHSAL